MSDTEIIDCTLETTNNCLNQVDHVSNGKDNYEEYKSDSKYIEMTTEFEDRFSQGSLFDSLDSARDAAIRLGLKHNCPMVTQSSVLKTGRLTMACVHSGSYRAAKKGNVNNQDETLINKEQASTNKDKCPCYFYGYVSKKTGKFVIKKSESAHNHHLAANPSTYHVNRTLSPENYGIAAKLLQTKTSSETLEVRFIDVCS